MTSAEPSAAPSIVAPRSGVAIGTYIRVGVVLLLFGGLAIALAGGWERLREYRWEFEPGAVVAAFAMLVISSVWAAASWFAVARAFGAPLAARPALRIYTTSNLGKYLPGKVGHAFARVYMAQQQGVPLALATTTVLTDIVLYIAAGLLIAVLALPAAARAAGLAGGPLTTVAALGAVVVGLAMLHPTALNAIFRLAGRLMPKRSFPPIEASYGTILKIFVLYVVLWGLNAVALFAGVRSVYDEIAASQLPMLAAIFALSYLSGLIVPLAPAGLGVREGLMVLLLSQLMAEPAAAAATVLVRVLQVAAEGLCAAVFSRA